MNPWYMYPEPQALPAHVPVDTGIELHALVTAEYGRKAGYVPERVRKVVIGQLRRMPGTGKVMLYAPELRGLSYQITHYREIDYPTMPDVWPA